MPKSHRIIEVTRLGQDERTGVPKEAQELLGIKPGDKIVWRKERKKVLLTSA